MLGRRTANAPPRGELIDGSQAEQDEEREQPRPATKVAEPPGQPAHVDVPGTPAPAVSAVSSARPSGTGSGRRVSATRLGTTTRRRAATLRRNQSRTSYKIAPKPPGAIISTRRSPAPVARKR